MSEQGESKRVLFFHLSKGENKKEGTRPRRISLSYAPFYASLLVIFGLTMFIGIFWMINEYQAYEESVKSIRANYRNRYRARVWEEHDKVIDFIKYKRAQADKHLEEELRDKVQAAYSLASHMYRLYRDTNKGAELRQEVAELLRPIRWDNDQGYYFAGRLREGRIDLFADEPWFEGKSEAVFHDIAGRDVVADIRTMIRDKGAGVYSYDLVKPSFPGRKFPTIVFVKYFAPFDWFIGAGVYSKEAESLVQQEILARIKQMSFGRDGEVLGYRQDGTIICSQDERLIGRSVKSFIDAEGKPYGRMLLQGGNTPAGRYIDHLAPAAHNALPHHALSFTKPYRDWGWVFATTISMADMEKAIGDETQAYKDIALRNATAFVLLFGVAVVSLLLIAYNYSLKIKEGIAIFTDFFRQAADSQKKIGNTDLTFTEFEDLRLLANLMVDDCIQKGVLLHRDELRLDTLLQLGMMEQQSLQDKYDFVLRRLVRITRSLEGYLALVDITQNHLFFCSHAQLHEGTLRTRSLQPAVLRSLRKSGLAGAVMVAGRDVLCNSYAGSQDLEEIFPYTTPVSRHLDVPVRSDGRVVMVAGVCNNGSKYDRSDVRQAKMLLEGLWLHVLKTSSQEEMARLERQVIMVSEEERANIGRDLHDDLGSHLTGIELLSKVLQQKLEKEGSDEATQVGAIRELIRDAIEKTRRLAQGLYPAHVREHGLDVAVEKLAGEVQNLFGVECTCEFQGDPRVYDAALTTHFYYILREAVFNAARHGKPDNIGIVLRYDQRHFSLQVADDGCGFDPARVRRGLGWHTVQYRAKAIGAELAIQSELDGGTLVTLSGEIEH